MVSALSGIRLVEKRKWILILTEVESDFISGSMGTQPERKLESEEAEKIGTRQAGGCNKG